MGSKTKIVDGWKISVDYGTWINSSEHKAIYDKCGEGVAWYGWKKGYPSGFISTILSGDAQGRLNFGNCWTSGIVQAYLNGKVIGYANRNTPTKVIRFNYHNGSKLELQDAYGNAVIQFNKFEVVKCSGKLALPNAI